MSQTPFLSEIKIFSFNFAPKNWAMCNGQLLPINQNQALFSLLGTMYGGNGQTTFALPDLRGRVPMHHGSQLTQGQSGGQEAHTITIGEMPPHNHFPMATSATVNTPFPTNGYWAAGGSQPGYTGVAPNVNMSPASVTNTGGSQPHENRAPFLVLTMCIALIGIFPSQN